MKTISRLKEEAVHFKLKCVENKILMAMANGATQVILKPEELDDSIKSHLKVSDFKIAEWQNSSESIDDGKPDFVVVSWE